MKSEATSIRWIRVMGLALVLALTGPGPGLLAQAPPATGGDQASSEGVKPDAATAEALEAAAASSATTVAAERRPVDVPPWLVARLDRAETRVRAEASSISFAGCSSTAMVPMRFPLMVRSTKVYGPPRVTV